MVSLQQTICGDVLHGEEIRRKLGETTVKDILDKIQRFRDYQFPVQIIQERSYKEVAKIFELVNSQGTSLTARGDSLGGAWFLIGPESPKISVIIGPN